MMKFIAPLQFNLICLLFISSLAQAETRYVTDEFEITLRSGPSSTHTIQRMLKSGASLTVLERDEETGYSHVKTSGGTEGWVLNRYLMREPAARVQLEGLSSQLAKVNEGSLRVRANAIKKTHDDATKRITELERENKNLQNELTNIKSIAANVLAIDQQNDELSQDLADKDAQINSLQKENQILSSDTQRDWFIAGALVLFVGLFLGLVIPKIQWRKRSRYDSF
ncbi:MAG: TIGR04211 family SH3 domain-containing protein [Nitrosomonas sp.]|nr:TIGR04211 family SH3 domain-containing protein [Nitrosomonas sp.]